MNTDYVRMDNSTNSPNPKELLDQMREKIVTVNDSRLTKEI